MDLKEENAIGGDPASHWYYISKGRAIKSMLDGAPVRELLDVGAGSGVFSKMLINLGLASRSTCVDPFYQDDFLDAQCNDAISFTKSIEQTNADTVIMLDVIEHVDDDVALMREYVQMAPSGTRFLISVPAFQFLWSSHDVFLDHRRRYRLNDLRKSVAAAGLEPIEQRYFFGLLFPAAAVVRIVDRILARGENPPASQLKAAPAWLNKLLIAIHDIERAILFRINKAAGVTAFCLAQKP